MNLLIYCAGGFGREVADIAERINAAQQRWDKIAFVDDEEKDPSAGGFDIYSLERAIEKFGAGETEAVIANGEPFVRQALLARLQSRDIPLATLADPSAVISPSAIIGAGSVIYPHCFISSQAILGRNVTVIAGANVGHDSTLGDNCMITGHVNIAGGCRIGSESFIGIGAQIKEGTRVGTATIIGMGSIVYGDVPDGVIAMGNPCRALRPNTARRVFKKEAKNAE